LFGVAIFLSSVGSLSGFTCFFMPGKNLTSTVFLATLLLASEVRKAAPPGRLLFLGGRAKAAALLAVLFLGLFLDEFTALAFGLIPIMFPELFWPPKRGRWWDAAKNACVFLSPFALFLALVVWLVPVLTVRYLGYRFDFLGSVLSYSDVARPGPHMSPAKLALENFLSLFGTSLVPDALSKLLPDASSTAANLLKQENNGLKLAFFAVLFPVVIVRALRSRERPNFFLRACAAAVVFLLAHSALNA